MPDYDDEDQRLPDDAEALGEIREQAREVRRQFHRERLHHGGVSDDLKITMTEVAIAYRDVLIDYRDDDVYRPSWGERDIDWVVGLLDETVTVERERPGRGRGAKRAEVPKAVTADEHELYVLLKEYDQMWRQLGLGLPLDEREGPGGMVPDASIDPEENEA